MLAQRGKRKIKRQTPRGNGDWQFAWETEHGKRAITAAELMKQLELNPEWVAERDARSARHDEIAKRRTADEDLLVSELAAVGVYVASVYDFVMAGRTPFTAIPVLVRHLETKHDSVIREGIIRSLGFPEARADAFEPLCRHYIAEHDPSIQFAIANALSGMARFDEVSGLPGMERFESLFKEHAVRRWP